MLTEDRGDTQR